MDTSNSKIYIDANGTKRYRNLKGYYHRMDGPAVEWPNGYKSWYKEGKRHRTDGSAIESYDGTKFWYLIGKQLIETDFNSWLIRVKILMR